MIDKKKVLAVIPARGGSKRLPRKNILPLSGKPMIAWTIDAAIKSKLFDEIMVNTDDYEIAQISEKYGAKVPFTRPEELSGDNSSSIDVIIHTLEWYKERGVSFTEVILLQPTSPLRNEIDIKVAYEQFRAKKAASVLSVCEVDHPTSWCNTLGSSLSMHNFIKREQVGLRSQDIETEYRINGAIYIWNVAQLLNNHTAIIEPSYAFIMPRERSIDIDEKIDFEIAQVLMRC